MSSLADSINSAIDRQLAVILGEELPILKEIKDFVIQSGGKRVRPLLLILLTRSFGCHDENAEALAAITEIIHASSLLHDDVIDGADERRGQPSGRALFGNQAVILGGDYLLACGIERLNRFQDQRQMDLFTRVIKHLSMAELLQMHYARRAEITLEIYQRIIYGKTAVLFEAAAVSAGLYAKQSPEILQALETIGRDLGMLFQIRDDMLDYFKASLLKKAALTDYDNGLYTYPVLELRERADEKTQKELTRFMELPRELRSDKKNHQTFLAFLQQYDCEKHCIDRINQLKRGIYLALQALPPDDHIDLIREQIERLTDF